MADKITSLKVASSSGTFSNEIPLGASASNVDITYNGAVTNVGSVLEGIRTGTYVVGNASKVNGKTVGVNVPSNAKFTDTTYSLASASANGLMSSSDYSYLSKIKNDINYDSDFLRIKPNIVTNSTLRVEGRYITAIDYDNNTKTTGSQGVAIAANNALNSVALSCSASGDIGVYRNFAGAEKWLIKCNKDGAVILNGESDEKSLQSYCYDSGTSGTYWRYLLFTDGTAICYMRQNVGGLRCTEAWGSLYYTTSIPTFEQIAYPFTFSDIPIETATLIYSQNSNAASSWLATEKPNSTTTSAAYTCIRPVKDNSIWWEATIQRIVIGRKA